MATRASRVRVYFDSDNTGLDRGTNRAVSNLRRVDTAGRGFGTSIDRSSATATSGLRRLDRVMDQTRANTVRLTRGLTNVSGVGMFGLTFGIGAAIREGIRFNSTMEGNTIALKQFLGSTRDAEKLLGRLFTIAKKTPFEFPDLVTATRRFLAFGFSAEEAEKTLGAVGNAVAGLGGGVDEINRITLALGQIQAKGKISGQELLQLNEVGIPAQQILRKELGLTADQVARIGNVGITARDGIAALTKGMNERFAGATQAQAKSFAGQISTLKDNTKQALGAMTDSLFLTLKSWLPAINRTSEQIAAIFKRKDLDFGEKVRLSIETAKVNLSPIAAQIKSELSKVDFVGGFSKALDFAIPRIANAFARGGILFATSLTKAFFQSNALGQLLIGSWVFLKGRKLLGAFGLLGRQAGSAFAAGAQSTATAGLAAGGLGAAGGAAAGAGTKVAADRRTTALQQQFGKEARAGGPVSQLGPAAAAGGLASTAAKLKGFVKGAGFVGVGIAAGDAILGSLGDRLSEGSSGLQDRLKALADVSIGESVKGQLTDPFGKTGITDESQRAKRLKDILDDVANSRRGITDEAAQEAVQLAKNLDLTRQQRNEVRALLDQGRTKAEVGPLKSFVDQIQQTGKLTPGLINNISAQLEDLPRRNRRHFAQLIIDGAAELRRDGKIKGSLQGLKNVIESEVDGVGRLSVRGPSRLRDRIGDGFDAMVTAAANPMSRMAQIVQTYLEAFGASGIEKISGAIAKDKASRAKGHRGGLAQGGMIAGAGLQDTVPVMVAPGEAVLNRHQQAPVEFALNQTFGLSLDDLFQQIQRPHFMQKGGRVQKLAKGGIVALGRRLQKMGYSVGEHPAFGGVAGVHVPGSYHYKGQALDVNDDDDARGGEMASLDRLNAMLRRQGWRTLWRVPDHFDHLHVDTGSGTGGVPKGGPGAPRIPEARISGRRSVVKTLAERATRSVRRAAQARVDREPGSGDLGAPRRGRTRGTLSKSDIKNLWVQAGGSERTANLMAAIALAESSGRPGAHGPPDGRGLWQIEWPIWRKTLGRFGNPYNALANARMAREVLKRQGKSAWVVYNTGAYKKFLNKGGRVGRRFRAANGFRADPPYQDYSGKGVGQKKKPKNQAQQRAEQRREEAKRKAEERRQEKIRKRREAEEREERRKGGLLDRLQNRLSQAQLTPTLADDIRALGKLEDYWSERRRDALKKGRNVTARDAADEVRSIRDQIRDLKKRRRDARKRRRGTSAEAFTSIEERFPKTFAQINKQAALAGLTPDLGDDIRAETRREELLTGILQVAQRKGDTGAITEAATALRSSRENLAELRTPQDTGSLDDNTAALEALNQRLQQQNELLATAAQDARRAASVSQSQYGVLATAIADIASGRIGGATGLGFMTPGVAGSLARY